MSELFEHHPTHHPAHDGGESNYPRPAPLHWRAYRSQIRYRWAVPFLFLDWLSQWAAYGLRRLSILELLETCSSFTLLIGLIFYFAEAPERTKTKHYQAWQVINTAQGKGGSGGRLDALHELNEDGVPLVGVDVSDAFLQELRLEHADLRRSNFRGADLKGAILRGSDFEESSLRYANLRGARLNDTNFTEANLRDTDLSGAVLTGANLERADLRDSDLNGVIDWKIADVKLANIHGISNPPQGFVIWAQSNGAVDLASDADWAAAVAHAQPAVMK
jgi:hypothetical protein